MNQPYSTEPNVNVVHTHIDIVNIDIDINIYLYINKKLLHLDVLLF